MPDSPAQTLSDNKTKKMSATRKYVWVCLLDKKRSELGLTMRDVAEACGVTSACICEIEHGSDPLLTTARKIATFFGTTVEALWPHIDEFP